MAKPKPSDILWTLELNRRRRVAQGYKFENRSPEEIAQIEIYLAGGDLPNIESYRHGDALMGPRTPYSPDTVIAASRKRKR